MCDIVIIGAGGFGREVAWLIERINEETPKWHIVGWVDDGLEKGTLCGGYSVLGGIEYLENSKEPLSVVCAIGSARTRKNVMQKILKKENLNFPNLVDPKAILSSKINLGEGNIICAGNILTVDIQIGDFNIINLDCTIGHDVVLGSFNTIYPGVHVSGCVTLQDETELGTGSQIIQGISIGESVIVGAGSVVIRSIPRKSTAVGNPAKVIKTSGER